MNKIFFLGYFLLVSFSNFAQKCNGIVLDTLHGKWVTVRTGAISEDSKIDVLKEKQNMEGVNELVRKNFNWVPVGCVIGDWRVERGVKSQRIRSEVGGRWSKVGCPGWSEVSERSEIRPAGSGGGAAAVGTSVMSAGASSSAGPSSAGTGSEKSEGSAIGDRSGPCLSSVVSRRSLSSVVGSSLGRRRRVDQAHRPGRTARTRSTGEGVSFCSISRRGPCSGSAAAPCSGARSD